MGGLAFWMWHALTAHRVYSWSKILRLLLHAFQKSLPAADFIPPPPCFSRTWDLYNNGWKYVGGSLALFTLSLCIPLKVALFFLLLVFIYIKVYIFPIETIMRNATKGGNLTEKAIQNNQSMMKTRSWIAFCRKTKTNVEISSLNIIPRNFNGIVLYLIPSLY